MNRPWAPIAAVAALAISLSACGDKNNGEATPPPETAGRTKTVQATPPPMDAAPAVDGSAWELVVPDKNSGKMGRMWRGIDDKACERDTDCVISCASAEKCCSPFPCSCPHSVHRDTLDRIRELQKKMGCGKRSKQCTGFHCKAPDFKYVPRCRKRRCTVDHYRRVSPP